MREMDTVTTTPMMEEPPPSIQRIARRICRLRNHTSSYPNSRKRQSPFLLPKCLRRESSMRLRWSLQGRRCLRGWEQTSTSRRPSLTGISSSLSWPKRYSRGSCSDPTTAWCLRSESSWRLSISKLKIRLDKVKRSSSSGHSPHLLGLRGLHVLGIKSLSALKLIKSKLKSANTSNLSLMMADST